MQAGNNEQHCGNKASLSLIVTIKRASNSYDQAGERSHARSDFLCKKNLASMKSGHDNELASASLICVCSALCLRRPARLQGDGGFAHPRKGASPSNRACENASSYRRTGKRTYFIIYPRWIGLVWSSR